MVPPRRSIILFDVIQNTCNAVFIYILQKILQKHGCKTAGEKNRIFIALLLANQSPSGRGSICKWIWAQLFSPAFHNVFNNSFSLVQGRKRTHKKDDRREFCTSLWSNTGNTLPSNWIPICIITLARTISLSSLLEFNSSEVLSL